MLTDIEGIIVKETPYGDTSKIINILTDNGIVGVLCKGAMGIKSKLRVGTMKLTYAHFQIYYKKDKLSILSSVDIINPFKNIKNDILLISYASYLLDLSYQVYKQTNDNKEIYEDLINALLKIEEGLNPMVITNILEVKLLDYLGVGLNLTSCIVCGNKKEIVTLSSEKGGLICKNCYEGERIVPISIVKVINMYYLVNIKSISKLAIDENIIKEINRFLSNYYDDYTGLYLKSKDFLKTIEKL